MTVAENWLGLLAMNSTYAAPATATPAMASVVGGSAVTYCQADCAAPVTDERADEPVDVVLSCVEAGWAVALVEAVVLVAVEALREWAGEAEVEL